VLPSIARDATPPFDALDVGAAGENLHFGQRQRAAPRQLDAHVAPLGAFRRLPGLLQLRRQRGDERKDELVRRRARFRVRDQRHCVEDVAQRAESAGGFVECFLGAAVRGHDSDERDLARDRASAFDGELPEPRALSFQLGGRRRHEEVREVVEHALARVAALRIQALHSDEKLVEDARAVRFRETFERLVPALVDDVVP
jgi:hypothetical protein